MKLSVIIVNYNVRYFLEQCLHSVELAKEQVETEVWVVDNNSVDGSCAMVKEKFPWVQLIENKENTGFSVANNQAIRMARGEYVLLLNPDTVVEEDTLSKVVSFMDQHVDAGGLGVHMIDGKGRFLPESKRGLPTPMVSLYKIIGLSRLFPNSKRFNHYHLGYLDKDLNHEVEILSGAFMLMRKAALDKVGLLDETFFMYGEDIDLSYRILQGGYKNYYFANTNIIHYKGESTKKGSLNYVRVFYNAMLIFANKHFSSKNARFFSFFINLAIYLRAFLSILHRGVKSILLPVFDVLFLFFSFWFIAPFWESIKYPEGGNFPIEYFKYAVPAYIFIWIASIWLAGGYEKPFRIWHQVKGFLWGTAALLIFYSLLPETLRYSRAMLLFGTLSGLIGMNLIRSLLHLLNVADFKYHLNKKTRIAIVGEKAEAKRVKKVLDESHTDFEFIGFINPKQRDDNEFIGLLTQLKEIVRVNKIHELIFCAHNMGSQRIIKEMLHLEELNISYKIAPPESLSIIGSNSIDTANELYTVNFNQITKPANLRIKRLLDFTTALALLLSYPINCWFVKQKGGLIKNAIQVLLAQKSWVGFYIEGKGKDLHLPKIKTGVLSLAYIKRASSISPEEIERLNLLYAKNYKVTNDIEIIWQGFKQLGKT